MEIIDNLIKMKYMKVSNLFNTICIFAISVFILPVYSCSDMNELADRFLDEGETIYAALPDSAALSTGNNRVQIEIYVRTTRIKTVRVYWNDKKDSLDINVDNLPGVYKEVIENCPEKNYIFNLLSFDKYGNKSLPYELSTQVFGETYQKGLLNRGIRSADTDGYGSTVTVNWRTADIDKGAIFTEVHYTNVDGDQVTIKVAPGESTTVIDDYSFDGKIEYRTGYLPSATAIDTFYNASWDEHSEFELSNKWAWWVYDWSSQHDDWDNSVWNIIDGTDATRWHTEVGGVGYPHFAIIDLDTDVRVSKFGLWATTYDQAEGVVDNRFPTKVQFLVSMDYWEWTDLGTFDSDNFKLGEQFFNVEPTLARYIKFVGVEGPVDDMMVVGEISVYVKYYKLMTQK
jgi:hypothetical protein